LVKQKPAGNLILLSETTQREHMGLLVLGYIINGARTGPTETSVNKCLLPVPTARVADCDWCIKYLYFNDTFRIQNKDKNVKPKPPVSERHTVKRKVQVH
jgi:hypothetical protein